MNECKDYLPYYLTSNPFPSDPSFNKDSSDKRVNGSIFNEEIFKDELNKLYKLMDRRTNLVYCQNTSDYSVGVGKSSIIAHVWKTLQQSDDDISSIFIRCQKKSTPETLCAETVGEWHRQGLLWKTLIGCLQHYVESVSAPEITAGSVQILSRNIWPVDNVGLRAIMVLSSLRLVSALTNWASSQVKSLKEEIVHTFFDTYLKSPKSFLTEYPKILKRNRTDEIELVRNLLELMELGGFRYHYLFLDQFEDPIQGMAGRSLIAFAAGMRRLLEIGNGRITVVVTLHPGAEIALSNAADAQEFITLAPLDGRHRVDVKLLTPEDAPALAITYLSEFRSENPPDLLFPFTPESVTQIFETSQGQIRTILSYFNLAIAEGVEAGCPLIDLSFVNSKHEAITGQIHPDLRSL